MLEVRLTRGARPSMLDRRPAMGLVLKARSACGSQAPTTRLWLGSAHFHVVPIWHVRRTKHGAWNPAMLNGTIGDVLLFGSFLVWAVMDRVSLKKRPARPLPGTESKANDVILVVVGLALYLVFVFFLHEKLIGVRPA